MFGYYDFTIWCRATNLVFSIDLPSNLDFVNYVNNTDLSTNKFRE